MVDTASRSTVHPIWRRRSQLTVSYRSLRACSALLDEVEQVLPAGSADFEKTRPLFAADPEVTTERSAEALKQRWYALRDTRKPTGTAASDTIDRYQEPETFPEFLSFTADQLNAAHALLIAAAFLQLQLLQHCCQIRSDQCRSGRS